MKLIPDPILYAHPVRTDKLLMKDKHMTLLFIICIAVVKVCQNFHHKIKVIFYDYFCYYDTHI